MNYARTTTFFHQKRWWKMLKMPPIGGLAAFRGMVVLKSVPRLVVYLILPFLLTIRLIGDLKERINYELTMRGDGFSIKRTGIKCVFIVNLSKL